MARKCGHNTTAILLLIGILATASAGQIRSPSSHRSLLAIPAKPPADFSVPYRVRDSPATFSGLQDATPTGTSTSIVPGHYLANAGLFASTSYGGSQYGGQKGDLTSTVGSEGTWGQEIYYGPTPSAIREDAAAAGITLGSLGTALHKDIVYMLDAFKGTAYQISTSTSSSGTGRVNGVFQTSPGAVENPVLAVVDSGGNAWVANLNTVGQTMGSVVKIKNVCTGTAGTDYSDGPTVVLPWAVNAASSADNCVVQYTTLTDNALTITALAIDGSDNLWILAGNSFTASAGTNSLNVYKVSSTGSTATLMYGPLVIPGGQFGSPGGNGAVVDAAGVLWTGSGSFLYADNGDGSSKTYSVLRFDTSITTANDAEKPILAFAMPDEANMLNLDSDSNVWVAGKAYVTKVFSSQITSGSSYIDATLDGVTVSIALSTSNVSPPISLNLAANLGSACPPTDGCCANGNFDAGVVAISNLKIYVANICATGLVFPITIAPDTVTLTLGTVIPAGSYLQAIATDPSNNIWLAGTIVDDTSETNALYVITGENTVKTVTGLTYATGATTLGGSGDLAGSIFTRAASSAIYTYLHDTGITGYSKWVGGTIGWTFNNYGTVDGTSDGTPLYTVTAQVGDSLTALKAASSPLAYTPVLDAPITDTLGNGRYLRVDVQLRRISNTGPTLKEIRVRAANHPPSAECQSVYVSATDDTTANGGLGSSATNQFAINGVVGSAVAGVCTAGGPISIGSNSFDSDTQEADVIVSTATEFVYNSVKHTGALPTLALQPSYDPSYMTVFDSYNQQATCSATVGIWDDSPPTYIPGVSPDSPSGTPGPALCVWPPNANYWCVLDIFAQSGGSFLRTNVLPIRDNCAAVSGFAMAVNAHRTTGTAAPSGTGMSGTGFACTDTDPRSQRGDCTLVKDGNKYNFCILAIRRTVYTNLDRVFTMQFLVQDAGTQQGLNTGTLFSRSLRIPAIWMYQSARICPRATYATTNSIPSTLAPTKCGDASGKGSDECTALGTTLGTTCSYGATDAKTCYMPGPWVSLASSSDGNKVFAAAVSSTGRPIYLSTNLGESWKVSGPVGAWASVASSSDGIKLVASSRSGSNNSPGQLYTSTDSGVTWIARDPTGYWSGVASSSDGTKLLAAQNQNADMTNPGRLYTSTDSGASWTVRGPSLRWKSVASSSDGTKLIASALGDLNFMPTQLYISSDSGVSWTSRGPSGVWGAVASSSDGVKLVAAQVNDGTSASVGRIYTSTDSGVTWTARGPSVRWFAVASSGDGTKLIAGQYEDASSEAGSLHVSTDSGVTWVATGHTARWYSVATSSDGTKIFAGEVVKPNSGTYLGRIYKSIDSGSSWVGI